MNSRLLLLMAVVAVSSGGCLCKMEARELFPDLLLDATARAKLRRRNQSLDYMKKLKAGRQTTVEEIFSNLTRVDANFPISTYKAHHYQRLARLSSLRCRKSAYDKAQQMCRTTTMRSLKTYCKFCLAKVDEYCQEDARAMARTIIEMDRAKPMVNGVDHFLSEAQILSENFEGFLRESPGGSPTEGMRKWCEASRPWTRLGQLSVCKRLVAVLDEEFAHLKLEPEAVEELVEEVEGRPIDQEVGFCRLMREQCKVMMDFELDLGRFGLGKVDGNIGLI